MMYELLLTNYVHVNIIVARSSCGEDSLVKVRQLR